MDTLTTASPELTEEQEALLPDVDLSEQLPERWQSNCIDHETVHSTGVTYIPGFYSPYLPQSPGSYMNIPSKLIWSVPIDGAKGGLDIYDQVRSTLFDAGISRLSPQRRERIINSSPTAVPVSVFENGMVLVDPGVWQGWMSEAGLKDAKDRLILLREPDFEKTNLNDDEVFLEANEEEGWLNLPLVNYDPKYWDTPTGPLPGQTLRVAEWKAELVSFYIKFSREGEEDRTITTSEYGMGNITDLLASEVIVGTDESGNSYITQDELDRLFGKSKTVDKEILKPGSRLVIEAINDDVPAEQIAKSTGLDVSRIQNLIELRKGWDGAYLVECAIKNAKRKNPYIACIFPEMVDGKEVEHVVAENAKLGNAVFIVNGNEADWRDVLLDKTKIEAVDLGAIRIPHINDWKKDVLDEITTPR